MTNNGTKMSGVPSLTEMTLMACMIPIAYFKKRHFNMGNIISCVYYKEIDICYLGELFHKVSGKESNKVVFTGTDTIVLEFRVNSP